MTHKVVPFTALIANTDDTGAAARQLETLIAVQAQEGWEYVRLERVDTVVEGTNGCFGFGATPARSTSIAMAVFRR
jgi:hypothetical protein